MVAFSEEKIRRLTEQHNWELVFSDDGLYLLRQKDKHHMKTLSFDLPKSVADKFLS